MAARKKHPRRPKAPEEPQPVQQPTRAGAQPEEVPTPPAEPAPPTQPSPTRGGRAGRGEQAGPPVAGIGASAGGLDAFKKFFAAMPPDSGVAFVLVPHLDPAHESLMVGLLARHTTMPVAEAENDMPVAANHVYIIPPNKYLTIRDGVLRLTGPVERRISQTSIDLFLRSLADDQQERSICIILSGTGSHGSLGLKAVKAAGGVALVQDPATAAYERMPQSAVATGLADYVLPVEQMPETLVKYVQHGYVNGGKTGAAGAEAPDHLNQVLALVRARTNLDFRSYRRKTLARRVERRLSLSQFDRLVDYLAFLREHPDEVRRLSKDLLISVTSFFRDPEAWRALETEVIAPRVRAKEPDAPLRLWSVGCATGEEPYSLGMLLLEQLAAAQKNCPVQIFATDVDADALEAARQAIYPENISADVSPERLARFFTRVSDSSYQVSKQLRETVTFAHQDLLADAPFSKLDVVVCRNLLIYLEPEAQKKVIALLHFALAEGGLLFLGSSESIGRGIDLFEPVSAKRRIYRRLGPSRVTHVQFPMMELGPRQARAPSASRPQPARRLAELAQNFLLRRYALACVVINRNHEVLHFAGPTEDYLLQPSGPPTHDLLALARPGLEAKLRVVIQRAIREDAAQSVKGVLMRQAGVARRVNIEVEPLNQSKQTEGLLLISFQEQPNPVGETVAEAKARTQTADSDFVRQLEQELETTREDLQGLIEELESSNEELKASNEEILSMNEELQSANEELETSKEELQSLNEELTTVNNQLHEKVQELETANNDMANLLNCTAIATVFLDASQRIKLFTPNSTRMFHLIAPDIGRPLRDIAPKFTDPDLQRDAEGVLRDLAPREKEVCVEDGHWYIRRIMPYRTRDNRTDGLVITFVDITERKQAADAVVRRLAALVESSADAIFSKDLDGTIRTWNRGAERLYGYTPDEVVGRSIAMLVPENRAEELATIMTRLRRGENVEQLETERVRKDGQRIPVALTVSPVRDPSGKVVSASAIGRDISERKRAEQALQDREERLQVILNTAADAIITIDHRGIIQSVNTAAERMFGYTAAEMLGQRVNLLMPSPYREAHDGYLAGYLRTGEKHIIGISREVQARRKDGSIFPTDLAVSEIPHLKLFTGIHRDLTERKQLEREVVEVASLEQRRIGQDLHDTVGQELTALSIYAKNLAETLRVDPANAEQLLERMEQGLQRSRQELRAVLRGLLPVPVDSEGLMAALADLADRTQQEGKVACTFDCPEPVAVADNLTATHVYLIAQEAVHNAVKHAQARQVRISLTADRGLVLRVQDDGIGMPARPAENQGLGLRIMRNRAVIIGATLTIKPAEPTGTVVTCVLARKNHAPQQETEAKPGAHRR
jgi:two-component system CheB/CheR fusion protein